MNEQMLTSDEVMDAAEAAEFLRVGRSWLDDSDVPRSRLGRRVVFLRSELLAYVRAHGTHTLLERAS